MIEEELASVVEKAFIHELEDIKASLDNNGGYFHCERQVADAERCIRAIVGLYKVSSVSSTTRTVSR